MSTVTYKNQPAVHATRGAIPLAGTSHLYTVNKLLWPPAVEAWIAERLISPTLHVCCGKSQLGDVRLDLYEPDVDVVADAARLPFSDKSFATVLIDPPYTGRLQWNHDMLNELHRVAGTRIIFQHWFSPVDKEGRFKKAHVFTLSESAIVPTIDANSESFRLEDLVYWQPRTYFGRVQLISVMTRE